MVVTGTYNPYLVALSILVATFASYTALDLGGTPSPAAWVWGFRYAGPSSKRTEEDAYGLSRKTGPGATIQFTLPIEMAALQVA